MKLMGLKSGVVGVACAMVVGMGAVEFGRPAVGLPGSPELPGPCPWDCEPVPDGTVGINDFLALLAQWGTPGSCANAGPLVGINDFLELLANWGPCPVAGPCGDPKAGDCCIANGTPGCEDVICCEAVCAVDPFCCDVSWDAMCAQEAVISCGCPGGKGCGDPKTGDCCVANGTPFCDNFDCCDFICAVIDPFCCDVLWDAMCAQTALQVCVGCP